MNSLLVPSNPSLRPAGQNDANRHHPLDFEVQSLEKLRQQNLLLPHRLRLYEIVWFKSGGGSILADGQVHVVSSNEIYCFVPGQLRQFKLDGDVMGYRIGFSQEFLWEGSVHAKLTHWLEVDEVNGIGTIVQADAEMQEEMDDLVLKMQKEFERYSLLRSEILSGLLIILLIHFSRRIQAPPIAQLRSRDADLVRQFKELLKKNLTSRMQVNDYAAELCVTSNYLNRTVKRITGQTASYHIQQQIILEAKRQAAQSNVSMKEIAYFLGFDNLAHFSKFFKNNSGMNFTSFKRNLQASALI